MDTMPEVTRGGEGGLLKKMLSMEPWAAAKKALGTSVG